MSDLPDPPISADVDLRDFGYMPLDVVRLRDSDLAAIPDAEVFRAQVISWCVAWHQSPAASLPDDDAILARLLGYGRDVRSWVKLRAAGALRGYVKCSDGRLYHTVVADKAKEAWQRKQQQRDRTATARRVREQQRLLHGESQSLLQTQESSVTEGVTESKGREGKGSKENPLSKSPEQPAIVDCPQQEIRALYAQYLPMLRQPRVWDSTRADLLRKRWVYCSKANGVGSGYTSTEEGLEFWRKFFAYVAESRKLTEGIPYEDGSTWKPDLPWLLNASNFAKVVEGKFHE